MQTRNTSANVPQAEFQQLLQKITELQETVNSQQATIVQLQSERTGGNAQRGSSNPLQALKSPPIPVFTGKMLDCTSTKVKGFISNVRRVARLSNSDDDSKFLQLAECHLQDRASTWLTRLEARDEKPTTLDALQTAMLREFVPSNEKAKAQLKLMTFKMKSSIDKHIDDFTDLVEICETPTREAYSFFFMSVPQYLKGKLAEEFPESDPSQMRDVYKCARKHEIAEKWATGKQDGHEKSDRAPSNADKTPKSTRAAPYGTNNSKGASSKTTSAKDPEALTWGPAQKGEGRLYRTHDRCCKCGKKPWSDPNHACRKEGKPTTAQSDDTAKN